MAHKKAAGSAKNLRDSNPKYRWVKLYGGQRARAWNIIIRQKGNKYVSGVNVYAWRDFTLHAAVDGIVSFRKKKITRFDGRKYLKTVVDILPLEAVAQQAVQEKTAKKDQKIKTQETPSPDVADTTASTSDTDDLTKIYGISAKGADALVAAWIATYTDLSSAKVGDIRSIVADAWAELTADAKDIKKQATLAKNGKMDDLKALQTELKTAK